VDDMPPVPCGVRPRGGWLTSFRDDGTIGSRSGPKFMDQTFAVLLAEEPKQGAMLSGVVAGSKSDDKQIVDVNLQMFELDGFRSGTYDQYFSAAVAIDAIDDK